VCAAPTASLIYFTEDGTQSGAPLFPGFRLDSVWSAMGQAENNTIYIAVSNHDEVAGNVAVFALDPGADRMRLVGDLKSVSMAAGNWRDGEGQYKVHTFLQQHADGLIYFATMTSSDPKGDRGAHVYSLDPETEVLNDISATAISTMTREGKIVPGTGVAFQGQGIKGLGINPGVPDVLYMVTYENGFLVRYDLRTGEFEQIGISPRVSYVIHVDAAGDVYYLGSEPGKPQAFLRYDAATGKTAALFGDLDPKEEVGMIVPTANPDVILVLLAQSKKVIAVHTGSERILRRGNSTSCGRNWWRLYNMAVSPDGKHVYFVSNNNDHSLIWSAPTNGGKCKKVLDVNELLGSRNLAFGGQNVWVGKSFYTPVWTYQGDNDLAILKVTVD
jgi:dipeptidyl aminopeptidase/acylaminoacyl peptidase